MKYQAINSIFWISLDNLSNLAKIVFLMESYPVQISLSVSGELPTPCHQLFTEVKQSDEMKRIDVTVRKALEWKPEERFATAEELRDELTVGGTQ